MKLKIDRSGLQRALGHTRDAVEKRNTIPILGCVHIQADAKEGVVRLTATDMDLTIQETIPAQEVSLGGAVTTPAHTLYDIVRKLPDDTVHMEASSQDTGDRGSQVTITSGSARFDMATLPSNDFPETVSDEQPYKMVVPAVTLRDILEKTKVAVSTEETRYYLNGVYVHQPATAPEKLRGVATDGHRLACFETELPEGITEIPGVIIPRKTINILYRLLQGVNETVHMSLSGTKVRLAIGNTLIASKVIDGTFPDYERVIPEDGKASIKIERLTLAAGVDRVSALQGDNSRSIRLDPVANGLALSTKTPEGEEAQEEIDCELEGTPDVIGFNSRYLNDFLKVMNGEEVTMNVTGCANPAKIYDQGDDRTVYVLMPMRV